MVDWMLTAAEVKEKELSQTEASCIRRIDNKASEVRDRFITRGVGQEAVYLTKYNEANAYKAASDPTASDYPYLNTEAKRRGMTMTALADEVIARRNNWDNPTGCQIEAERVGGKDDVRSAATADEKRAAADAAIATLDRIQP